MTGNQGDDDSNFVVCKVELSIFVNNRYGTMKFILDTIFSNDFLPIKSENLITAFNLVSLGEYGILRVIVDTDENSLYYYLCENGFSVSQTKVLAVKKVCGKYTLTLNKIANILGNDETRINIDYAYESADQFILCVDDREEAAKSILKEIKQASKQIMTTQTKAQRRSK